MTEYQLVVLQYCNVRVSDFYLTVMLVDVHSLGLEHASGQL